MIRYYGLFEGNALMGIVRHGTDGGYAVDDVWSKKEQGWRISHTSPEISGAGGDHPFTEITREQAVEYIKANTVSESPKRPKRMKSY